MENINIETHEWDWEVVPDPSSPPSCGGEIISSQSNYFSVESGGGVGSDGGEEGLVGDGDEVESDNPSWVDPTDLSIAVCRKSSSSSSDDCEVGLIHPHSHCCAGFVGENQGFKGGEELGFDANLIKSSGIGGNSNSVLGFEGHNQGFSENSAKSEEIGESSVIGSISGELGSEKSEGDEEEKREDDGVDERVLRENVVVEGNEDEKKRVVWWKVPLEVLKYCVLRVSPVWSLSMAAAALMGFVILRRRYLYRMKRKSLGIQLSLTVDDKKVSQLMSRAARLNEAFSVVKRVPIIRPALPAPGMVAWPVMSLR